MNRLSSFAPSLARALLASFVLAGCAGHSARYTVDDVALAAVPVS